MDYDPRTEPHKLAHDPVTSLVVPRPIGWISTIGRSGVVNLAPYSFFNLIAGKPPFVMFASNPRKHSQQNAETTGEFVANIATWELREEMNRSAADYADDKSEPEIVGLEMVPSRVVKPPRVARSPISLECQYQQTIALARSNGQATTSSVVIGEVVNVHIDDGVIRDGLIDLSRIRPLARLGYMDYTVVDNIFTMVRVDTADRPGAD
ncbi:MAG TPA: flavin reductase family protein [Xanthobacteraceae bacterium]|nr:flavin reductase family protein [Xanthobacteraceae bacterium]